MSGAGFLAGTTSPAPMTANQPGAASPSVARSRASNVFRRGGGGDGEAQAGGAGFVDQPGDAGAQRQAALLDAADVVRGLGGVQAFDQIVEIGPGGGGGVEMPGIVADAFLAAGDVQQAAVQHFIPIPVQPVFGESCIKGRAMAVALGFGQRAVDIEDQGLECVHGRER